jgi:hypothetical protein
MAIRIPILTSFDPKGLKQANASFATLQNNIGSLSRNFAVAGVAIGAAGAFLGKAVNSASNLSESVNAVNVAFGTSADEILKLGENAASSLGLSKREFNEAAVAFSSFAERIVGKGADTSKFIQELTTRAADFASVYNLKGGVSEALERFRSGLAGQTEPLAKFGVNLLDSEVKAYALQNSIGEVGKELTATEKVQARYGLLMQETSKTAGDFANTSDGLANGMRRLQGQIEDTQAEIGAQLLPVLEDVLPIVREMATELGEKLTAAVKAVDWKSVITSVANFTATIITNMETISKTIGILFALNTAYKLLTVVIGLTTVATDLYKWAVARNTTAVVGATAATGALRAAMLLLPWGIAAAGIGLVIAGMSEADSSYRTAAPVVTSFGVEILKTGHDAQWAADKYGVLKASIDAIPKNVKINVQLETQGRLDEMNQYLGFLGGRAAEATATSVTGTGSATGGGKGGKTKKESISAALKREGRLASRETKLLNTGISAGFVDMIMSTTKSSKGFKKVLKSLTKDSSAASKAQRKFNKTKAGKAELASIAAEEAAAAQAAAAARAARIAEEKRIYDSFLDSVKSTFGNIKNAILGAFDLPQLGSSTDAIIRNMNKLLDRTRKFASNISKLAGLGLNATLLQQVIAQGPMAGAALAEALTMGGPEALASINAGYSEFGNLSGQIATTGTNALFGTQAQQNIYNINVSGGVGSGATIGQAIVQAIKDYERVSGAVWQGA